MDYKKYLHQLLTVTVNEGASDLHINVGLKPHLRVDGELVAVQAEPEVEVETASGIAEALFNEEQKQFYF